MRHATAAAGLLGLAACAQPAETGNEAGPAPGPTTVTAATTPRTVAPAASRSTKATRWNAEDACALLEKSTVRAALGTEIVATELATVVQRTDASAGFSTCLYKLADGQQVAFMARQSPVADNTPEAMGAARDELRALTGSVDDVTGVGKGAFWSPKLRQLVVFLGDDRYFNVTMPADLGAKDPKTIALGLATRIE